MKAPSNRFWKVRGNTKGEALVSETITPGLDDEVTRDGLADVPLIVEDLLCQVEDLRVTGGNPAAIADLLAQVDLLQGR